MPQKKIPAENPCVTCEGDFYVYPSQTAKGWGRFCSRSCGSKSRTRDRNAFWNQADPSYQAVHYRMIALRGSARKWECISCCLPAHEWAYDHKDANQLVCPNGRPYSLDEKHYVPMCRKCHRKADGNRK